MAVWLHQDRPRNERYARLTFNPIRLDGRPAPCIMAHGINGVGLHQYFLLEDGMIPPAPDPAKPPYRVPTMEEIAAVPWNGRTVASLFSGCGGSSLGYKMAGFRVGWANEFVAAARKVYRRNHPGTIVDGRDVRQVRPGHVLAALGLGVGELDLLDGSPPCASFSTAGQREAGWGKVRLYSDTKQRVDDLFYEYVRLLRGLRPKAFVAENVSGLIKGKAKGYFKEILAGMRAAGYRVRAALLDAQWLGVPQMRQRVIFVGVRADIPDVGPAFPKPLPYRYTIRDAIPWISGLRYDSGGLEGSRVFDPAREPMATVRAPGGGAQTRFAVDDTAVYYDNGSWYQRGEITDEPAPPIVSAANQSAHFRVVEPQADISGFAIAADWDRLGRGEPARYFNSGRPSADGVSRTVTATGGSPGAAAVFHPTERRKFSIAELRRICAFPDDFKLTGSYSQQWERLGRAVPPVMMYHIARTLRDEVFARFPAGL